MGLNSNLLSIIHTLYTVSILGPNDGSQIWVSLMGLLGLYIEYFMGFKRVLIGSLCKFIFIIGFNFICKMF